MAKRSGLDIETYNSKRDFSKTAEPKGATARKKGDSFVVQKHDASRLHWDFRLEMDGVLKSWAVPKGPSIDPDDKRLAVRTEDHPLDYGSFEGTIPQGEYGGGTVMLWDRGKWIPEPGKDPRKTIEEGHLHFRLEGERMKGDWVMFRLKGRPGEKAENWMLKKVTDEFTGPGEALVEQGLTSITTGRSMAEIAAGTEVWKSNRGGKKGGATKKKAGVAPPAFRAPQLATLVDAVPSGPDWLFEYKYDGYRLLLATGGGAATTWTRNGNDWSDKFRGLVKAASALPAGCLIDGEAVALGDTGKPDFQLLQASLKGGDAELAFYAFDLLVDQGEDITGLPNLERKQRLAALLKGVGPPMIYGDHILAKGEALFDAICAEKGEGIIAKKASAPYRGARAKSWLKIKCIQRREFLIVGWQASDKRRGFRSLHLAVRDNSKEGRGKLAYAGKVGTGFDTAMIESLSETMRPLGVDKPPLDVPRAVLRGSHWIEPKLVCEVAFTEFTGDGVLRHPSFIALRSDKRADQVVREVAEKLPSSEAKGGQATAASFGVKISNPDRVIFPGDELTKGQLADYYAAVSAPLLVTLGDRPMTLIRCPQSRAKHCFFQKHDTGSMGDAVHHVAVTENDGAVADYLYVRKPKGILECVQMGTIEFHGWGSRIKPLEKPDRLVFDLDPDVGLGFDKVKQAAERLRGLLADLGLITFPMLTGGKGIHVIAPLDSSAAWPAVKSFAERFSRAIAEAEPEIFTANIRKKERKGRIFLDWLRNQRGATAVMPYSARARDTAPVAAPIDWSELDGFDSAAHFTIRDAGQLLERASSNLLAGWGEAKQKLPDA